MNRQAAVLAMLNGERVAHSGMNFHEYWFYFDPLEGFLFTDGFTTGPISGNLSEEDGYELYKEHKNGLLRVVNRS